MLSNLNSCHGVFIPTDSAAGTVAASHGGCGGASRSGNTSISTSTRHYRSYYHNNHSTHNDTKRNKRPIITNDTIWAKIEEEFTPELVEEQQKLSEYNIPESVHQSPKQTSMRPLTAVDADADADAGDADAGESAEHYIPTKKMSALFIKPETDVECLYRKSGIREKCEVCASDVVLTDDGFLTCKNPACSILYKDESLDQSAEWRYYGADDNQNSDPTRCGMPVNPLLKESSYGCKVMCEGGSYSQDMMKIRRYTEWQSMPYREKAQYDMFQKITIFAQNKGISKMIIDEALRVHKRISEHKTFRSLNRDGVVGASIYIACKIHNCPRTPKEIATIFNLDNTSATKGCKNAVSIINELESNLDNSEKTNFCKTKPEAFIERYCSRLSINDELTKVCQFIAVMIEKQNLIPENTPHSIASGIIYFVACMCNLPITKKDVNRISDMSEVTINKCYKKLYDMRDKLIPKMIIAKYAPTTTTTTASVP
jgi:transcription initiation factor TFIIB